MTTNTPFELNIASRVITVTPDRTEDHENKEVISGAYTLTEADQLHGTIIFDKEEWKHDKQGGLSSDELASIVKLIRDRFESTKDE